MRTVAVVTVGRSDYGLLLPILHRLRAHSALELMLLVTGMHLAQEHGLTVNEIERDGFVIDGRVHAPLRSDGPEDVARAMGDATMQFADVFERRRPDVLLVLGDRYEMHAAVVAALPFAIPVAHIHGGESTEGLIDEAIRHSVTKMSHLHFAATERYARRIVQMGEEPWRVTVSGAPGLDLIAEVEPLPDDELTSIVGRPVAGEDLLVTYHPVTLEFEATERHAAVLLAALEASGRGLVFTSPNADTRGSSIARLVEAFVAKHPDRAVLLRSVGSRAYFALLRRVAAMVGNSSSGIIEAASFELPVVNVGSRQQGRLRPRNVIDVGDDVAAIADAIRRAAAPAFRASLAGMENPYGDGRAAERIVDRIATIPLDRRLLVKRFHDIPETR